MKKQALLSEKKNINKNDLKRNLRWRGGVH
jgi:hypothetical protein